MKISDPFNRFYHAILNEAFTKARSISFRQWKEGERLKAEAGIIFKETK